MKTKVVVVILVAIAGSRRKDLLLISDELIQVEGLS